jgi:hypothetical protein
LVTSTHNFLLSSLAHTTYGISSNIVPRSHNTFSLCIPSYDSSLYIVITPPRFINHVLLIEVIAIVIPPSALSTPCHLNVIPALSHLDSYRFIIAFHCCSFVHLHTYYRSSFLLEVMTYHCFLCLALPPINHIYSVLSCMEPFLLTYAYLISDNVSASE